MTMKSFCCAGTLLLLAQTASAQETAPTDSAASGDASFSLSTDSGATASTEANASSTSDSSSMADSGGSGYMDRYKPVDNLWEVGLFTGLLVPSNGHELFAHGPRRNYQKPSQLLLGGRLGYYPSKWFGVEGEFFHGEGRVSDGFRMNYGAYRAQVVGQLPFWSITPFVLLGGGALQASGDQMGRDTDTALHFGIGVKVPLHEIVGLRLDLRENATDRINDDYLGLAWHEEAQLALTFTFDRAPAPVQVVSTEPPDRDNDNVPDGSDQCPDTPALTADGCPLDTDDDGVNDLEDHCPREAGEGPNGCPNLDEDGDDILIPCDVCPKEKGVAPDGCPIRDADSDGILDDVDKCPKEPETKNGFEDKDGCPDELPKEVEEFTGVIKGIQFDRARATIRRQSEGTLKKAVAVLEKFPSIRVEISGHTSSEGDADFNQKLSQERAESVRQWLLDHGIAEDRIEARGAGSAEPIADNKTEAGRQQNRRIEFKILTK